MVFVMFGYYATEYDKKPVVKEKIESGDIKGVYDFYITTNPNVVNRPYYGSSNAPIMIVAYMDVKSDSTKTFFAEFYPEIKSEYINQGKIRLIHKNYLTNDDIVENTERYTYAKALSCMHKLNSSIYFDFYQDILDSNYLEVPIIASKYTNITTFESCIIAPTNNLLLEDMSEVENFGMVGINPRFYIGLSGNDNTVVDGIPTLNSFKRTIKNFQTQIGD